MKFVKQAAVAAASALALSGCSLLYPHWGATTFPTDSPTQSQSASPSASASQSSQPSATPSITPMKGAQVQLMNVNADATAGVIDVVAQVTNVAEDGGQCVLTVISGNTSKSISVKAESNVDTTQCFPMELPLVGLQSGTALVTVMYRSSAYLGTSPAQAVVIP